MGRMKFSWVWLFLLGWSPVWALLLGLLLTAHPGITLGGAALAATRLSLAAAIVGLGVRPLTRRLPWPHPMRVSFFAIHLLAAAVFAHAWVLLNSLMESIRQRELMFVVGIGVPGFLVLGVWLYVIVAGVSYAVQATQRAARVEALAARAQLAALRAQLNPHFLFNALHTVVQLIPREPQRAAQAAEQLAGLLRTTIEADRDIVTLESEWAFVERYLEIERIRFGDRLTLQVDLSPAARVAELPSFALQTLVENAVRHAAMPRVEPTELVVAARLEGERLILTVQDSGAGADPETIEQSTGTGLRRLGERLATLYGQRAHLDFDRGTEGGFTARLTIPQAPAADRVDRSAQPHGGRSA
jgi:hypothetical protein